MPVIIPLKQAPLRCAARQELKPYFRHLIRRLRAQPDTRGRLIGIPDVVGGIVVNPAHCERGAPGQHDGLRIAKFALPVKIPIFD